MKRNAMLCAVFAICIVAGVSLGQTRPSDSGILGDLQQLTALGDGKLAVLTSRGVYVADDDKLAHWTSKAATPQKRSLDEIVGGTSERIYLVTTEWGNNSPQLMLWTAADGMTPMPKHLTFYIKGLCSFIDGKTGCYAENQGIIVTRDGGESWRPAQEAITGGDDIASLTWVDADTLVLAGRPGSLALCHVDVQGHVTNKWTVANVNAPDLAKVSPCFAVDTNKQVWVTVKNKLQIRKLEDGKLVVETTIKHQANSILVSGDLAYIWWTTGPEDGLEVWQLKENKLTAVSSRPKIPHSISGALLGKEAFAVTDAFGAKAVLVQLQSDINKLKPLEPIVADNKAILDEEAKNHVEVATSSDMNTLRDLIKQLPQDVTTGVMRPINARNDLSPHAKAQLMIEELNKIIAARNATTNPK